MRSATHSANRFVFCFFSHRALFVLPCLMSWLTLLASPALAEDFVPRRQSKVPGPPLSPTEAMAKMQLPEGFTVELVAAEPDIQNPVAMAFDRRGRIWVTESFEYPRREAGPGRDRIKILEDTDHDGRADSVKIFAEGLNIPSGIAIGHGGVWVGNAPDLLFMQDTNGDDRADHTEVVVTGFGRADTHELPNAFTWSPEGHLLGLNGVFNPCSITQAGKRFDFTCAMWRVKPRGRQFDLFCEGTSNPWGIAHDTVGNAFISACVIDHLWHLTETGYYHRQAGSYPPYTWKIESIVDHAHQLAAYCGLNYFDSPAYPEPYRDRLYMGNIHGGCINVDSLERRGSTYVAHGEPDFLTANDVWFMPVSLQIGPDGCLYVLDWYDRFHCYQDANHDPAGVDRGHGRLYRIRYQNTPRAPSFNLETEASERLVQRLHDTNSFFRDQARQVLAERGDESIRESLEQLAVNASIPLKTRLAALWSLLGYDKPLQTDFHLALLQNPDPAIRMWGVRAAGNQSDLADVVALAVTKLSGDPSPDVQLQRVIAATKQPKIDTINVLYQVSQACADDRLIPQIVWQNLLPLLPSQWPAFQKSLNPSSLNNSPALQAILPRTLNRLLDEPNPQTLVAPLLSLVLKSGERTTITACLESLEKRTLAGELGPTTKQDLAASLETELASLREEPAHASTQAALRLSALWGNRPSADQLWQQFEQTKETTAKSRLLPILVAATEEKFLNQAAALLQIETTSPEWSASVIQSLSSTGKPTAGKIVLATYAQLPPETRPKAIEMLTQRAAWSQDLLTAIESKHIPKEDVGLNALRKIAAQQDPHLQSLVLKVFGSVRTENNQSRQQVIDKVRELAKNRTGTPELGKQVYQRTCGQCHSLHGEGQQVGPDITRNGRGNFDQLLSNMLDPNLVIGQGYQARTILTDNGRVLSGLIVEDNAQRVVLKVQGGQLETIPRDQIEELREGAISLMPEGLETQMKEQELLDLLAYLTLEHPPEHKPRSLIPGTPTRLVRE